LTLSRLGKRDEAAEHYRQALRINPNYAEAQTALRQLRDQPEPSGSRNR
jgi:tetratricopeptide (TPR) repeat protein